jgi:hypothetical protein
VLLSLGYDRDRVAAEFTAERSAFAP